MYFHTSQCMSSSFSFLIVFLGMFAYSSYQNNFICFPHLERFLRTLEISLHYNIWHYFGRSYFHKKRIGVNYFAYCSLLFYARIPRESSIKNKPDFENHAEIINSPRAAKAAQILVLKLFFNLLKFN